MRETAFKRVSSRTATCRKRVIVHWPCRPPRSRHQPGSPRRDELVSFSWAARLSAHDTAAALPLVSLAPRLATQVDVDHQHRRVVLEPPKPGRRVLRSQRKSAPCSRAVGRHPGAHTLHVRMHHAHTSEGRRPFGRMLGGSVALPAILSISCAAPCHRMTVRPRFSLLMRSATLSSKSAARCAVAAPRTSLHACVGLITSHSPSLASSSREWVPGMGARQSTGMGEQHAKETDANAPGAAVTCHVGFLR